MSFSPEQWDDVADRAARILVEEAKQAGRDLEEHALISIPDAAKIAGKSDGTIRNHFAGKIIKRGGSCGIRLKDFRAYLQPDPATTP